MVCNRGSTTEGFPGGSVGKEATCQCRSCRRHGFNPWVRKIPWRREWLPTPIFQGQRSLVGYSPWGCKESNMTEQLTLSLAHLWRQERMSPSLCFHCGPQNSSPEAAGGTCSTHLLFLYSGSQDPGAGTGTGESHWGHRSKT